MTLTNGVKLVDQLNEFLLNNRTAAHHFLHQLCCKEQPFMLRTEIRDAFKRVVEEDGSGKLASSPFKTVVQWCQEAVIQSPWLYFALRKRVARWIYIRIHLDTLSLEIIDPRDLLHFKEQVVTGRNSEPGYWKSILNLSPGNFSSCRKNVP
jgi:sucrose synthase